MIEPIPIELWEPSPDHPGCVRVAGRRPIGVVLTHLNVMLREYWTPCGCSDDCRTPFDESDFAPFPWYYPRREEGRPGFCDLPWPPYRWIAVFPVTGGNEGHYVHIEVLAREEETAWAVRWTPTGAYPHEGFRPGPIETVHLPLPKDLSCGVAIDQRAFTRSLASRSSLLIGICKTFRGWKHAAAIAARAGEWLGA